MEKLKSRNAVEVKIEFENLEEDFIGFNIHDDLLMVLEKKKNSINMKVNKEIGRSTEKNELLDNVPAVNNNYVGQKNKSKSRRSLPENNDKHSQSVSKKHKKERTQMIETMESLESNVDNLEFLTPTFNLTSPIARNRRNIGRRTITDINDPIFKLPFDYGWKRELVYRTSADSTAVNRANRSGDVYYYSPNNRKLRSLREIQEQLNLLLYDNDHPLTIECFTFLKQPIGINDKSKELIREANAKLSKEESFVGAAVRLKKIKTPVRQQDQELSENENNKSSNKMKIVFKNVKKTSPTKPVPKKSNSESMNTSSSTPEYVTEDWQAIQSSTTSNSSPSQTDDGVTNIKTIKRRLSTSDGEVNMLAPCGIRCPNNDEPATLMCAQCLVYYHPACVNLNANLKIVGYVCINCRSSVRQRNRRVQSSHTVVVGASESEQLRVEPIRIRQVHQTSDTPNFFIDRTPISKTEEPNHEIDDEPIDENSSDINTVTCQGNVYKTIMAEGKFQEQYVYEMKQTRGPSLMTCVVQVPKNLDEYSDTNGTLKETTCSLTTMQSLNYMVVALRHVFKHLKIHELLAASRVCTAWNIIAMNRILWQNMRLKNSMVHDWGKCIDTVIKHQSVAIDTRRMLIPTQINEYESFWLRFSNATKRAKNLTTMELYRCPTHVIEDAIYSLPQLEVLNAVSIKNPNAKDNKSNNEFMILNLGYLGQMTKLTEIRLKAQSSGIKLLPLPSFENLTNLRILSLTSIKSFPKEIYRSLDTLPVGLEFLEIGDCDCLSKDFALSLKRLVNLLSLRLENCTGRWEQAATDVFHAIRSLENLKILELINIDFTNTIEVELEKCHHIKALMIIPAYVSQSATTNWHLLECLKKMSKTLTHLVWGITHELLRVTDIFMEQYQENQHFGFNLNLSKMGMKSNNIPILRARKEILPSNGSSSDPDNEKKFDNVDMLSIPALENLLADIFVGAKTKVIKVSFAGTTRAYLADHFNDVFNINNH